MVGGYVELIDDFVDIYGMMVVFVVENFGDV